MTAHERSAERGDDAGQQKRRLAYSLAAGAAGACAPGAADAQVTFRDFPDIDLGQGFFINLYLDYDPYYDIRLENYVFDGGNYQGAYVLYSTAGPGGGEPGAVAGFFDNGNAYASALSVGDLIDSISTAGGPYDVSLSYGGLNPSAEFTDVQSAFIGVAFPIFDALHFGWVRVDIDNAAGEFTIFDVGFNFTPGAPILAGQVQELENGDYNDDGVVDALDYTVFRETQGDIVDPGTGADGDGNGEIGPGDFVAWAEDFGFSALGDFVTVINPPAPSAIPEPATLGLLAAGAAGLTTLRSRQGGVPTTR